MFASATWMIVAGLGFGPLLQVFAAGEGIPIPTPKQSNLVIDGSTQILTCLSTDKPFYRGGETAYFKGVLLQGKDHTPPTTKVVYQAYIQIKGPKGDVVAQHSSSLQEGIWSISWAVPKEIPGGEYKIIASYPGSILPTAERKFDVRNYRAPRLNSQIKFLRDGYGPGEKVTATLEVKRAEGGLPAGATVAVRPVVDGVPIPEQTATVDNTGHCTVSFTLPTIIEHGEGTLALTISDGGVVETASKTIPILIKTVDVQLYPEGGRLVAGLTNRVYIQALQSNGKPADLEGSIKEIKSGNPMQEVCKVRTEHEGRGRFEFKPEASKQYALTISKPAGIKETYALPSVDNAGAVIRSTKDVFKNNEPVTISVATTYKNIRLTVSKKENELGSMDVISTNTATPAAANGPKGFQNITFPLGKTVDGVLTVTAWTEDDKPLAERLIFREPAKTINIKVTPDKSNYEPGEKATLKIKTTDDKGSPISANVGLNVSDESIFQMADKREQAPSLPVMFFLEPEVSELADAQVYFDKSNPKAPMATDLLLGTQGWRKFATVDLDKFIEKYGNKGIRAMAVKLPSPGSRIVTGRIGEQGGARRFDLLYGAPMSFNRLVLPAEIGRVEGPRDINMFSVEPTVVDERHYTSGRSERHQKTSPTLPEGAPIPDNDGDVPIFPWSINQVDRYAFFGGAQPGANTPGFVYIREFAHKSTTAKDSNERKDFAETLYWNPSIKTDATTGEAKVEFDLNDSITSFRVAADGFTQGGALGASHCELSSLRPLYAEAKLPLEVTSGDKPLIPISVVNTSKQPLNVVTLKPTLEEGLKTKSLETKLTNVAPGGRLRTLMPLDIKAVSGDKSVVIVVKGGDFKDKVNRTLKVRPDGFPMERGFGGTIEPGKPATFKVHIDKDLITNSVQTTTSVNPAPLGTLTSALERLILDPSGCFEQTSSTSYPLTMAQQYFKSHRDVDAKLIETSREKLNAGYKRLTSFWCPDRGYEWFGQNPGHDALTAYGLLHFEDMAKVMPVDRNMINITRNWLISQKDGQGGFERKAHSSHGWTSDRDCSNAYIVWALLETGQPAASLQKEIDTLKDTAEKSKNSYVHALAANALYLADRKAEAKVFMQRIAKQQVPDGKVDYVISTMVGSGGEAKDIEGTALSTLAWLRDDAFATNATNGIKYLTAACKGGRYGSTQSTVLALRAIMAYEKKNTSDVVPGKVRVFCDGQPVGDWIAFDKSTKDSLKLPDLGEVLTPGDHEIQIRMEKGMKIPYSTGIRFSRRIPDSAKECKVNLAVKLAQSKLTEGQATEVAATVTNLTDAAIPTPIAIIGLPGGMEPRHEQLKELVKKKIIDSYEVRGREVVFYWRSLDKNEVRRVPLSVVAAIPGTYTGPASRAYLYYTDEHKKWVDGLSVEIGSGK